MENTERETKKKKRKEKKAFFHCISPYLSIK